MIDTHGHLNLDPLVKDYQEIFAAAQKAGVNQVIIPGVNFESSEKAVQIANEIDQTYPAIGLHPHEAEQVLTTKKSQDIFNWLIEWGSKPTVVAIGECGLDYFRLPDDPLQAKHIKAFQKKLFKLHIKAALQLDKPLIIHIRDVAETLEANGAHKDAIDLLEKHRPKGVLHCFSGDQTYLSRALELGMYISFAGNVTFSNAGELRHALQKVSQDRLLVETDAPFLNPNRGDWPNTPANIAKTYQVVAEELSISLADLIKQVKINTQSLFRI